MCFFLPRLFIFVFIPSKKIAFFIHFLLPSSLLYSTHNFHFYSLTTRRGWGYEHVSINNGVLKIYMWLAYFKGKLGQGNEGFGGNGWRCLSMGLRYLEGLISTEV